MARLTESIIEDAALAWLESLGWQIAHGPDIVPETPAAERLDYGQVVLEQRLRNALTTLNPDLPAEALDDAFRKLTRPEGPTLEARNRAVHRLLVDGVTVEYRHSDGRIAGAQVRVIDFDKPDENDFLVVNQFTVAENKHTRRPDVVVFINGLPLVLIELKNAADEDATIWSAFQQFQTYKAELLTLFAFNALLVISDGVEARIGTFTAGREWFKPWRTIAGETLADPHLPELQMMLQGVFDKKRLLDLLGHFLVFEDVTEGEEVERKGKLKGKWAQLEAIVGAEKRLKLIAQDIVEHFERRLEAMDGKAMVVCMSRRICMDLHDEIVKLRPARYHTDDEKGVVKVVMTGNASEGPRVAEHARNKPRREALAKRFRDASDPFKVVIVRDMWLTGFDAPSLHTMYLDKPMRGHGLMRTIARELVKTVRANVTIDWTVRENVRAQLRVLVKRILRKYGYPPDKQEKATQTVLEQAALLCSEWAN